MSIYFIILLISVLQFVVFFRYIQTSKKKGTQIKEIYSSELKEDRTFFIKKIEKLAAKEKWKITKAEFSIYVRTRMSLYSCGETIDILFSNIDDNQFVHIISMPMISSTVFDYGKNKENIDKIKKIMN